MTPDTRKKLGIVLGILLFILAVGVFTVPRLIDLNHYNATIVSAIEKAVGGKAQLGRITWGLNTGLWLEADGFSLNGSPGILNDVAIKRIRTGISLLPLLAGKIVIKDLLLENPDVSLNLAAGRTHGTTDTDRPMSMPQVREQKTGTNPPGQTTALPFRDDADSQSTANRADKSPKILITGLTVKQGRLTLNDTLTLPPQTIVRTFADVAITADYNKIDRTVSFELSLRDETQDGSGSLAAKGSFIGLTEQFTIESPQLTVNAAIKDQNVAAIKPYLRNDQLAERLSGSVSFEIDYTGDFSPTGQASGSIDLTHMTYTDPSSWNAPLPGVSTELIFATTFTPDELVIEKADLSVGKITIDGRSRMENWKVAPVFKDIVVSATIPLAGLTSLVPWQQVGKQADLLKEILAGGGTVKVEKASLDELDPAKLPENLANLWTQVELTAGISAVSVQPSPTLPKVPKASNISAAIRLADGIFDIDHLTADIAAVSLPEISVQITRLPHQPLIDVKLKGPIEVVDSPDESLHKLLSDFGFDKLAFTGDLDLTVHLETARPEHFGIEGTAGIRSGLVKTVYSPVILQGLNADVTLASDMATVANLVTTVLLPTAKKSSAKPVSLALQGQLKNLNRRPSLNLQSLKTSPISLTALAAVIPWARFDDAPKVVKDILNGGGTIEINQLSLPYIDLAEPFNDPAKLLSAAKGSVNLAGVTVRPVPSLPAIESISGHPRLEKGVLTTSDLKARIGPLTTPTMNIRVTDLWGQPKFTATAKGPMRVAGTEDASIEKILENYGLKSFDGNANVDFDVFYDHANPNQWSVNGSATLEGIQAVTYPAEVRLKNLRGRISLSKQKSHEWVFENLSAEINAAPIRLNGKISGNSTTDLAVDLKAETRQLDLAAMSELIPSMKDLGLRGKIDLDMDIYLPHQAPLQSRLTGRLTTDRFELHHKEAAITVEDINADLDFSGRSANINRLTMRLNQQLVNVSGQMKRPEEPALDLVITSPNLDIDRLLFAKDSQEKPPEQNQDSPAGVTTGDSKADQASETKKPRFLRLSSANIRLEAQKGRFRGQDVEDLRITADYEKGVIKDYTLDFNTGGGHAAARGMIDMRHPDHIAFIVEPDIKSVQLQTIVSILGADNFSTNGPLTASGQLRARTGTNRELLSSLNGSLNAEMGQGLITVRDSFGISLVKMLRFMSFKRILSVHLERKLEGGGLPFNSAKTTATIEDGRINIDALKYDGASFTFDADGSIDLPGHQLKVNAKMAVFEAIGTALKFVPIVGKAADAASSLYFTIDGSLDDPSVRINPARGVVKGTEEIITAPERTIKDIMKFGKE